MKKSKYQQYFHCFIVCIISLNVFWFSYQQNIVTILRSTVFRGAALLEGGAYFNVEPEGAALMRGWCLIQEIRYFPQQKLDKEQTCGFKFQIIDNATMVVNDFPFHTNIIVGSRLIVAWLLENL